MKVVSPLPSFFALIFSFQLQAQPYTISQHVEVRDANSNLLYNPWDGGTNCPQFGMADLNKDGVNDVVVYEQAREIVRTYKGEQFGGSVKYKYAPEFEKNFPTGIRGYLILMDYNCDAIPDLFERGMTGVAVHKGYYDNNQLKFSFYKNLYFNNNTVNVYVENGDIPGIVDIDGDGDLDVLSYNILGGQMNYYQNQRVEESLPCDSMKMLWKEACWGHVYQGFTPAHVLQHSCPPPALVPGIITYEKAEAIRAAAKTTHSGNTICFVDFNQDGVYDYLNGGVSYNNIQYLINGKTSAAAHDSIVAQDTAWGAGGHDLNLDIFPAAFWLDWDQNGVKDLIISPHSDGVSDNVGSVNFYQNNGSVTTPNWQYKGDSFFVDQHIDHGTNSQPIYYDYNKDGKLDLLIAGGGAYSGNGVFKASISYYENTSTPGNPSFQLKSRNLQNFQSLNLSSFYIAIGDLDNDGKDDLVLSKDDGKLSFYKNMASSNNVQPNWALQYPVMKTTTNVDIDMLIMSRPFIEDINNDGKKDLLIGRWDGYVSAYTNPGTTNAILQFETHKLGGMATLRNGSMVVGNSSVYYGSIDNSGKKYFLLGNNYGTVGLFERPSGSTALTDTFLAHSHSFANIKMSGYSHPSVADVDGDGMRELVIGEHYGGIQLYHQQWSSGITQTIKKAASWNIFPNPAQGELTVEGLQGEGLLQLTDLTGKTLQMWTKSAQQGRMRLSLHQYAAGVYLLHFTSGSERSSKKVMISGNQ